MLNKQTTLYLYRGATSSIEFDFTNFDFNGGTCTFTISNICKNTKLFQYTYNIMYNIGNERYPQCADSDIIVRNVVNSYE